MICLDTNYLIRSLVENSTEANELIALVPRLKAVHPPGSAC